MTEDFRSQAFYLYREMHGAQMGIFNTGWDLCMRGHYDEGIALMRQGNRYGGTETYLLIIGLGEHCRKDHCLPERAESLAPACACGIQQSDEMEVFEVGDEFVCERCYQKRGMHRF